MAVRLAGWMEVEKDRGFVPTDDSKDLGLSNVVVPKKLEVPDDPDDILDDVDSYPPLADPHYIAARPMKSMNTAMVEAGLVKGDKWFAKQNVVCLPPYSHHEHGRDTFPML